MSASYQAPPMRGTPVSITRAADRRALIGKRIEWSSRGWTSRHTGTVEDSQGRNLLVSGDWKWAPDMSDVCVLEEEQS